MYMRPMKFEGLYIASVSFDMHHAWYHALHDYPVITDICSSGHLLCNLKHNYEFKYIITIINEIIAEKNFYVCNFVYVRSLTTSLYPF
jgi:hypothetical protein